ncbi:MAG: ATP-binding protein [bacterium]
MTLAPESDRACRADRLASFALLCSHISHGLRNPLSAILLNAQMAMLLLKDGSPLRGHLQDILLGAQKMESYLERLQQLAKPGPPEKMPFALSDLADQALKIARGKVGAAEVRVFADWQTDVPRASCDPLQIRQALVHLLANALEALPPDGELRLTCRWAAPAACAGGPGVIELQIEDSGCGISRQHLTKIFDPFFTTKPNRDGLGLTVAWLLLEANGGSIQVESELGRGTRLIVRVPAISAAGRAP